MKHYYFIDMLAYFIVIDKGNRNCILISKFSYNWKRDEYSHKPNENEVLLEWRVWTEYRTDFQENYSIGPLYVTLTVKTHLEGNVEIYELIFY